MTATVGGRYKILDESSKEMADVEVDLNWENWGKRCDFSTDSILDSSCTSPGQFRVQIDSGIYTNGQFQRSLETNAVNMGLRNTFGVRAGGSYRYPLGDAKLVGRAGVAYDTAAAKEGWLRANFDGAARITTALGAAYDTGGWQVNAGFMYIHEGTNTNPGASADGSDCNPTAQNPIGCGPGGAIREPKDRQGPTRRTHSCRPTFRPRALTTRARSRRTTWIPARLHEELVVARRRARAQSFSGRRCRAVARSRCSARSRPS